MTSTSFNKDLNYNDTKVAVNLILETSFSKEIRILFKKGQRMNEHKAPYPIVVHLLEGKLDFGVNGTIFPLEKGGILTLEGNVPHDLTAKTDCTVRLTLYKKDNVDRVKDIKSDS